MKTPDQNASLFERIDYGVRKAVRDEILDHKLRGHSIVVWEDGKVIEISPEDIKIPDEDA